MFKKILIFLFIIAATTSFAQEIEIDHFVDITHVLHYGYTISILTDFSQCTTPNKNMKSTDIPTIIGKFEPNETQIKDDSIASSMLHFTMNNPKYLNQPIYEFVRYSIQNDDSVTVTYQDLNPTNFAALDSITTLNCKLGTAAKVFYSM